MIRAIPIAALALAQTILASADRPATSLHGSLRASEVAGFKISSCSYTLADSKAGNKNYWLVVTVKYVVSKPVPAAVRFAFDIDDAVQYTIGQDFRLGNGSKQFKLISPEATVHSFTCSAVAPIE
ncbi:MAG: hypothetical protein WAK16_11170 [Candidatus Cybelea sp.]